MRNLILLFTVFACIAYSCNSIPSTPIYDFRHVGTQEISVFRRIDLEAYDIYKPGMVFKHNNDFVIFNEGVNPLVSVLDLGSDTAYHGLRIGQGPKELLFASSFHQSQGNFYVCDFSRKIIYQVNVEDSVSINEYITVTTEDNPFMICIVPNGFMANTITEDTRESDKSAWVTLFDNNCTRLSSLPFPQFENTEKLPIIERSLFYQATRMIISPNGLNFVCASIDAGVISFSQIHEGVIKEHKRLLYGTPKYVIPEESGAPVIGYSRDGIFYFCSLACTNEYVLALYSGKSPEEYGQLACFNCNHLLVYDWEGNPVKHYTLEKSLRSIDYDPINHTIVGIGFDPEGVILEYKIDDL